MSCLVPGAGFQPPLPEDTPKVSQDTLAPCTCKRRVTLQIQRLVDMGFSADVAERAYTACEGDLEEAAMYLLAFEAGIYVDQD